MISLIDYLGYIALKGLSFLLRLIPLSAGLWLARRLGVVIYVLNKKRATIAATNVKAAATFDANPRAIRKMVKGVYQNLTQTLVEILSFPRFSGSYVKKYITFEGVENLEAAKKKGDGIIFLTGHFGNWELFSIVGGIIGYSMLVLAREQKHSRLNDLLNSYRELTGSKVIKKGFAVKEMLTALHDNQIIGLLVDQDAGKRGVFVDFFGRKTSFAHGPMSFALKTNATILPTFIVRRRGPHHTIVIEKPIAVRKTGAKEADTQHGLQEFATILESYIRRYPDQWLWVHKRWKSTPTKKIAVLSDGKAGHLNQSLAVAEAIQRCRRDAGYRSDDTECTVIDVNFKNSIGRCSLHIGALLSGRYCHRCMGCLKSCLEKNSYEKVIAAYADIIISCGSSLASVNMVMANANGAKNIIVMRPPLRGMLPRYSLVIAPRHDRLQARPNIVITEGAPSRITHEVLRRDSSVLAGKVTLSRPVKIGVLIGGDNPAFSLSVAIIHELIDALSKAAEAIDAELLVTTSRRTSPEAESILRERLAHHPRCPLLVIANEQNPPEAIGGILGLSDIVVVSGESISMISEALQSSKHVIVFELEKRTARPSRHEAFLQSLTEGGYIRLINARQLDSVLREVWAAKLPVKKLDDSTRIYEGVKKLI
jgi:KDO2-lipid IV(A) lauroyltransferase